MLAFGTVVYCGVEGTTTGRKDGVKDGTAGGAGMVTTAGVDLRPAPGLE